MAVALSPALLLIACSVPPSQPDVAAATKGMVRRSDFEIVDCLLPGEVRQLGNMSFLTQRRPIRTVASECWIRGGEYVAYDRADLNSALRIWMEAAQAGDPEAQTNVAEMYERGLGLDPDYGAAAMWYQKAAEQGYSRALFNLGTLYEQGQGVPKDSLKALNLYRQAAEIPEDSLIYVSAAQQEQERVRQELETSISEKDSQLELLQKQLKDLQRQLAKRALEQAATAQSESKEVEALKKWIAQLAGDRRKSNERLAALPPRVRAPQRPAELTPLPPTADERSMDGINFGRYYAVVIGNQDYQTIEDLQTSRYDAQRISRILRDKYGFSVTTIEDADDMDMLRVLNDLDAVLRPEDNLLIYYAGHGERVTTRAGENGYWLPVNADPSPKDTFWLPTEQITMHLARLPAKRILVVSDACYGGLLSNDPSYLLLNHASAYSKEYLKYKLQKRSRLLLSSGGNSPVLDEGGGGNSVFARAFADELEANTRVLATPELFRFIRERVEWAARRNQFAQTPELKSIKGAGHEVGDFFFVPVKEQLSNKESQKIGPLATTRD
jgi:uncharacterized protein